jgi:hypothetical protein
MKIMVRQPSARATLLCVYEFLPRRKDVIAIDDVSRSHLRPDELAKFFTKLVGHHVPRDSKTNAVSPVSCRSKGMKRTLAALAVDFGQT